jgi:hypothetical protein
MNQAERLLCFSVATLCVILAFTIEVFYWGRMGGGTLGPRMPTWLARTIILAIARNILLGCSPEVESSRILIVVRAAPRARWGFWRGFAIHFCHVYSLVPVA